ncbi:amino acid racemase [Rubrivirga sp. S365]|uniref:aspartate/glutamate racemase family protein n=1 Tax=Rubrivirga sp. S365 TaxID=3076080 RepID=UPI0028C5A0A9|nr:amino acid racemase [Rubrivirga sp. S365]MDT7858384.1 amino acid racemase [Rubrivirga sp. S365]
MTTTRPHARRIGVVGGVGPAAGLDLVAKVHAETRAVRDQDHLPVALLSLPALIPDRTAFLLGRSDDDPGPALADVAEALVDGGAEVVGVPCNTAHAPSIFGAVRDRVGARCDLVDMVGEVGAEAVRRFGPGARVGVLSTTGTRASGVYRSRLTPLGVEVVDLPDDVQDEHVQPAIYDGAYGVKSASSPVTRRAVAGFRVGLDHLVGCGVDAVVLACTEIPLAVVDPVHRGVPLLDATRVLARALVRRSCPSALRAPGR